MHKPWRSRFVLLFLITLILLSCAGIYNIPPIELRDPKVGSQLQEDGHIVGAQEIPADTSTIYFEAYLDVPSTSIIMLEYRWYYEDELLYSYTGRHSRGYLTAALEVDPVKTPRLPAGVYAVQVWFVNTMLAEVPFKVQEHAAPADT